MTAPIKKVSKLSKQMADMDFSGFCSAGRTDEIGVLSDSLNTLSRKLEVALSELQEANQKLQADIDMERRLEKQRVEFFAAASHELKTPITIIKGQLQGMLYQVGRYKDRETYLAQSLEITDTLSSVPSRQKKANFPAKMPSEKPYVCGLQNSIRMEWTSGQHHRPLYKACIRDGS